MLRHKLTSEQFLKVTAPEDLAFELSEGDIVVLTKPGVSHQEIVGRLFIRLARYCQETGWGRILVDVLVRLAPDTTRAPDISGVHQGRLGIIGEARLDGGPDLAIEVHSSNRLEDVGPKFAEYQAAGVRWYWMIDPVSRTLHAYSLGANGVYALEWQGRDGDVFHPNGMPGLALSLQELWPST